MATDNGIARVKSAFGLSKAFILGIFFGSGHIDYLLICLGIMMIVDMASDSIVRWIHANR